MHFGISVLALCLVETCYGTFEVLVLGSLFRGLTRRYLEKKLKEQCSIVFHLLVNYLVSFNSALVSCTKLSSS